MTDTNNTNQPQSTTPAPEGVTKPHTDIDKDTWIEEYIPEKYRIYAYLARADRPIGIWLLLLPCWWGIMLGGGGIWNFNIRDIWLLVMFALGAIVMRSAGCVINDLWDYKFDSQVERTQDRPLASNKLSASNAFVFLSILMIIGFFVLMQTNPVTIILGVMAIPLVVAYPLMKRYTWWPQAFLGVVFNLGALMGWAAVAVDVPFPALLLYAGAILWTTGYDTIYAHQDKDDDANLGIKSTALMFGEDSKKWVMYFYAGAWTLIFLSFLISGAGIISILLLGLPAAHFYFQLKLWDMDDPASSLAIFRSNRDAGLLIFLAAFL